MSTNTKKHDDRLLQSISNIVLSKYISRFIHIEEPKQKAKMSNMKLLGRDRNFLFIFEPKID